MMARGKPTGTTSRVAPGPWHKRTHGFRSLSMRRIGQQHAHNYPIRVVMQIY